ncbi:MAG: MBL fold metallo-hydrolase [Bacteroides sp.]|nr:MBL fold metallo-hydrolase [Bacteroides sp.]MCM1379481.1 MBL fold metallo-hydrolase [Bacteroides sp.]MCM1445916.1 MBL fold metallo-hydrolase [Prevotella sp.]
MSAKKIQQYDSPGLFTEEMLGEQTISADAPLGNLEVKDDDPIQFMSFGSGSSGNCSYIGDKTGGFLIDAGVDPAKVENELKDRGIDMTRVRGILLTHDHGDHVRYVYSFLRNNRHMLVYCTPKVMNGILRRHSISRRIRDYHRAIYKEFEYSIGNFIVTPFDVSHDGTDNCGFFITHGNATMAVATDLGCITERVRYYMSRVNFMVLESNYDLDMLRTGSYPDYLKARIEAEQGHLDNVVSAEFAAGVWSQQLSHIFLCHLSHDNNRPEKAVNAYRKAFNEKHPELSIGDGLREHLSDLQVIVLPRFDATPLYVLRPILRP